MEGLPLDAWVLLVVAVGSGLGLQVASWWAHRKSSFRDVRRPGGRADDRQGEPGSPGPGGSG